MAGAGWAGASGPEGMEPGLGREEQAGKLSPLHVTLASTSTKGQKLPCLLV